MKLITPLMVGALLCSTLSLKSATDFKLVKQRLSLENSKVPTYMEFDAANRPMVSEMDQVFARYFKSTPGFSFVEIGREEDQLGFVHIRYEQTYEGHPIELAEVIAHTKNQKVYSFSGKLMDQAPVTNSIDLSENDALQMAKIYVGATSYKWESVNEEYHLKFETNNPTATYYPVGELKYVSSGLDLNPAEMKLTYKFNIYAQEPLSRQEVYIDAQNGNIVFYNNLIHTANSQGTAVTAYSGTQTITTDSLGPASYRLRSTGRGNGIFTYDLQRGTDYSNAVDFTDSDNFWNNVNNDRDQYATDAQWGSEGTYDYYFTKFGRNSINNAGFPLVSYLHYSVNFNNAFWDGQRMTYGDGNANSTPLCALDVASHEVSHGLTTFTANLVYANESGALNESFSDIFGTAVEFFHRPNRANWTIGEDIGNAFRSMSNPNGFGDPDTYNDPRGRNVGFWVQTDRTGGCTPTQANDQCGVHSNSGVQNHWFYLLTTGGTGTNGNGDTYNVAGIGIDKAAAIAYRNLTVYLIQSSNFDDARFFSIQSAIDLYGACSPEHISTTNAWQAVGVGNVYTPGVTADFMADFTSSCAPPMRSTFVNNSNNATSFRWDFGDGTGSLQREPSKNYVSYGQFDVKLVADGGLCGIDSITKLAYIDIDTANPCVVTLSNGTNPTQLECRGKLYDSGGSNGSYSDNENGTITIAPLNAASVTLTFASLDIEPGVGSSCNYDFLQIFDGSSTTSPSIGVYCNNNIPTTITSTSGAITIQFISDPGVTGNGFEIDWQCNLPSSPPVTNFMALSTTTCNGEIAFSDVSGQAPSSWSWDFGDGNISFQQNPIHTYTTNGTFDVTLVATNSFGSDTLSRLNYISVNRPAAPTTTNDSACIGQSATLASSAPGSITWYTTEIGGTAIASGNNINLNRITSDSTVWSESLIAAPMQTVGAASRLVGGGTYFNGDRYLIFDVTEKIELVSVVVFANSAGNRTIELRDNNGVVLQSFTRFIPVSTNGFNVSLNFTIDAGTDYQLGVPQGSQPDLYRNDSGTNYPYSIANKISIKGSSAGNSTGFYYFFYNWRVKSPDCVSARTSATAFVDTTCNVTGIASAEIREGLISVYPNPARNRVTVSANNVTETLVAVKMIDLTGKTVYSRLVNNSNKTVNLDVSEFASGIYFMQVETSEKVVTEKIIISK